jgi:hypothetical protein
LTLILVEMSTVSIPGTTKSLRKKGELTPGKAESDKNTIYNRKYCVENNYTIGGWVESGEMLTRVHRTPI